MALLDGRNAAELRSKLREALRFRGLRKALIHVGPLVVLAVCRCRKVLCGAADAAQLLEPHLRMLLLVVRGQQEQCCNLLEAFLLRLRSKVRILVSRLGLTGKCRLQILLRLGSGVRILRVSRNLTHQLKALSRYTANRAYRLLAVCYGKYFAANCTLICLHSSSLLVFCICHRRTQRRRNASDVCSRKEAVHAFLRGVFPRFSRGSHAFHRLCRLQYAYTASTSSPSQMAKTAFGSSPGASTFLWLPNFVFRAIHSI